MRLSRRSEPFDSGDFIYELLCGVVNKAAIPLLGSPDHQRHITPNATEELKIDGFRALAHLQDGRGELVSRNGNTFHGFTELANWLAEHIKVESAVLDGEIACVAGSGRPVFRDLLFRKGQCIFIAFDLLYLNGKDLRVRPLLERKALLKKLLRRKRARVLYLDHVEADGCLLFEQVVKMDLEGIVCKRKSSPYKVTEKPSPHWIKVKNRRYSQLEGREELFER
jgi:bifunctional non-homologous end joining protein LigD